MSDTDLRIQPAAVKTPGESLKVEIDLFDLCAVRWKANELIAANEYVRPTIATGFAYQASGAGTTGGREPRWPTTLGGTVVDGSITWTAVAASANGINAASSPTATSDPTGLTISNVSIAESRTLLATYVGGTDGQDFEVLFAFTIDSLPREARHKVQVRKV